MLVIQNIKTLVGNAITTKDCRYIVDSMYEVNDTHYIIMISSMGNSWEVKLDRNKKHTLINVPLFHLHIGIRKFIFGLKQVNNRTEFLQFVVAIIEKHCKTDKYKKLQ